MYCSRRLYKGNSYEFCLPLADTGVTEVYFYTDGEFKVGKEPVICGDTMCFTLAAEDIEAMKDGVLRYTDNGDLDTNTPYVVVTPEGYEAKTLDEIMEEAYQSGFTDGYASGITECHPDYSKMPITFECVDASGGTAYIVCPPTLYKQLNDGPIVPSEWVIDLEGHLVYIPSVWTMEEGDTMRFWASSATTQSDLFNYGMSWWAHSNNTGKYKIYGNIMSLQYEQDEYQDATELKYTFIESTNGIFSYSSVITDASDLVLPATTLIERCYRNMFAGCINLTAAPVILPAAALVRDCYSNMFYRCTSLTTAPELPATTLAQTCYRGMFSGCTGINYIKCLATDISASNCTINWLQGVSPTGTFETPSTTNWETGINGIPEGWTRVDVN